MALSFRLFEPSDLELYLSWVNQEAIWRVDNPGAYEFRTAESFAPQWHKIVSWRRSWVVSDEGCPVGYVGFITDETDNGLTDEFFIVIGAVDSWGKGVCKATMTWLFDEARRQGLARLTGRVLGNNERALRFYQSLGFDIVGQGQPAFERDGEWFETVFTTKPLD